MVKTSCCTRLLGIEHFQLSYLSTQVNFLFLVWSKQVAAQGYFAFGQ
jgi:hypothetical protein